MLSHDLPRLYSILARYAGEHLLETCPEPIIVGRGEPVPNYDAVVYVAVGLDGGVMYVGSVSRAEGTGGAGARLKEHMRLQERFEYWHALYLFPLRPETPVATVRRTEGRIGRHLSPTGSKALPKIG